MQRREFLNLARDVLAGTKPRHRRGAVIDAYYSLLLECRDLMVRWGFPAPPRHQVHAEVRLRLTFSTDAALKKIGDELEYLSRDRNLASYNLQDLPIFGSAKKAQDNIDIAANALAVLDAIDADPVRKAAAIASIRP